MFIDQETQIKYIKETYPEITDKRIDDAHWDLHCSECGVTRGFFVTEMTISHRNTRYDGPSFSHPYSISFHCPVCKLFKIWIVFHTEDLEKDEGGEESWVKRYYKVTSLPGEGLEDIDQLPEDPSTLRVAYRQAVRAMDANAYIAAAAMFRRALQVITRDILGAKPSTLANELNSLVGEQFNGVTLSDNFSTNSYIIKETGNQSAHPDEDPDLLDFTEQDANDLQKIFMELVSDLFIVPDAVKQAKEDFMKRRKIIPPTSEIVDMEDEEK